MDNRAHWLEKMDELFEKKPIVWLAGVRRAGKTMLCKSVPGIEYLDCELPSVRRRLEDPESFWKSFAVDKKPRRVALDEIHRLDRPSEVLKIAADHFADRVRVIATGSSTLGASLKFKDTLTGRKSTLWLTPMIHVDVVTFTGGAKASLDWDRRMLQGGLPPFFLADAPDEREFQEWFDSYWAKDIQDLFRVERRASFLKFAELLLAQSGGIFEASSFAAPCEVSRTTIANYLAVLHETFLVQIVRPFHGRKANEIISAPKVYGFDTGFVAHFRGVERIRPGDRGDFWEHLVLNELQGGLQVREVLYWRDKQGHEVDFVYLPRKRAAPIAIEAKHKASEFDPRNLTVFRRYHPEGANIVVCSDADKPWRKKFGALEVRFVGISQLKGELAP